MATLGYVQLTRECNQKCRFCSNPPNENVLNYDKVIEYINNFKKEGYDGIIFTGGEPTLYNKLDKLIKYTTKINLNSRIITNGQKLSDINYLENLVKAGLNHIHLSFHSYKDEIQSMLSENEKSLENIKVALSNCGKYNIKVDINTVINKYNSDHLDENVKWIKSNFPYIKHFVWNNIDPNMNRVSKNPDVIPRLQDFEISLFKACNFLSKNDCTFRIERVPLCYMTEYAEYSTETRKIVKNEERIIYFLDDRGTVIQNDFFYNKAPVCKICKLEQICAGIYCGDKYFSYNEIYPVFVDKNTIINKIKNEY